MKVLVTGGAGFIGRYTVDVLLSRGHQPIILDHYNRMEKYPCPFIVADVANSAEVTEAMAHADAWIHLAAVLGTQETISNPIPAAHTNLMGGLNMLQAAAQYDLPGVYIGVGNHWMNNPYSISKTMVERFVNMYNNDRGTRVNVVRAMNAYGPFQRPPQPWGSGKVRKITPTFCCKALTGQPIEVYGDGSQISDMIYVRDVAYALVVALEEAAKGNVFDEVVEVGPQKHNTVQEIAQMIANIASEINGKPPVEIVNLPMRPGEIPNSVVSANVKTLDLIGMSPEELFPIEKGMEMTVEYFYGYTRNL